MFYKVTNYSPLEFRKNDKLKKYLPFDYSSNLYESLNINKVILNNIRNTKKTSKIIVKQLKK